MTRKRVNTRIKYALTIASCGEISSLTPFYNALDNDKDDEEEDDDDDDDNIQSLPSNLSWFIISTSSSLSDNIDRQQLVTAPLLRDTTVLDNCHVPYKT